MELISKSFWPANYQSTNFSPTKPSKVMSWKVSETPLSSPLDNYVTTTASLSLQNKHSVYIKRNHSHHRKTQLDRRFMGRLLWQNQDTFTQCYHPQRQNKTIFGRILPQVHVQPMPDYTTKGNKKRSSCHVAGHWKSELWKERHKYPFCRKRTPWPRKSKSTVYQADSNQRKLCPNRRNSNQNIQTCS